MAVTLVEMSKLEQNPLRKGVIDAFLEDSVVMRQIPWESTKGLAMRVTRMKTLPNVGFRLFNQAFTESTGTYEQVEEAVYPMGADLDIDVLFTKAGDMVEDIQVSQQRMTLRAVAYAFNDYFINGDTAVDPKGFEGLKKRVANLPATQTITGDTNGLVVNTDSTTRHKFLDKLDELIYAIDGHQATALYMNSNALLKIRSVLRREGLLAQDEDQFGRRVDKYGEVALYDIGVKADQTTLIIPNNETQGTSSTCTSIYACRYGNTAEYLHGIQLHPVDVRDLGELQSGPPVVRHRVEWPVGLALWHPRSVARLRGIDVVSA